jgi:hypothetical protein
MIVYDLFIYIYCVFLCFFYHLFQHHVEMFGSIWVISQSSVVVGKPSRAEVQ